MKYMKSVVLFLCGILVGAVLIGGAAAVAALTATPSTQIFYVDGQRIALEAYAINGNNYIKLRDIGRAVNFGVAYDGTTNTVHVDSAASYAEDVKASPAPAYGVRTIPQSDIPFRPLAGDIVLLDDGTTFTVTDSKDVEPPLPVPTCDWSQFPALELPKIKTMVWHEGRAAGTIAILNLYETRRMQYTLYNAAPNCPELWDGGKLKLNSNSNPLFRLLLGITEPDSVQPFWPWRDGQLTQVFYSAPGAQFAVEAWDIYKNGKFLYTEYNVQGL